MFNALLNNPAIIKAAAKAAGIQAARLDYNPAAGVLVASLRIRGRVVQHEIPTGKTFTTAEILAALFQDPDRAPGPRPAPIGASPP